MIKKIIHIADIHIRTIQMHDLYKEQFTKLIKEIQSHYIKWREEGLSWENIRIVIAGDIAHQKINISNEQLMLTSWFLKELTEYGVVIIIPGNHDFLENNIQRLDSWISLFVENNEKNNYKDIDNVIYNNSIKNLESILESKKNIMNTLISEEKINTISESYNLPISSMVKIANDTLKKELTSLNESDKKELSEILKLNGKELKEEFEKTKKIVLDNLKVSINESTDNELKGTINKTINKVMEAKCNHYDYYKLKKLSFGL